MIVSANRPHRTHSEGMWKRIERKFRRRKGGVNVVRRMIEVGLRVGDGLKLYVGDIAIDDTAIARSAGVDRRVVRNTVNFIVHDEELRNIFTKLKPIGSSLVNVADQFGYGVLVIYADPHKTGIIAGVTSIMAEYGLVVRQALADDPDLVPDPKLTIVVGGKIPSEALDRIRGLPFIKKLEFLA